MRRVRRRRECRSVWPRRLPGGGGGSDYAYNGGNGGSGIVIIRYATATGTTYTGSTTIVEGTINFSNGAIGPSGTVEFCGGTLQYAGGNTQDISDRIMNSSGAIRIDTNSNNVTFGSDIVSTNTGGLVKIGTGTLTLTGANAYSGDTTVYADQLTCQNSNALGSGDVTSQC